MSTGVFANPTSTTLDTLMCTVTDETILFRQYLVVVMEALQHCLIVINHGNPMRLSDLVKAYESLYGTQLDMTSPWSRRLGGSHGTSGILSGFIHIEGPTSPRSSCDYPVKRSTSEAFEG